MPCARATEAALQAAHLGRGARGGRQQQTLEGGAERARHGALRCDRRDVLERAHAPGSLHREPGGRKRPMGRRRLGRRVSKTCHRRATTTTRSPTSSSEGHDGGVGAVHPQKDLSQQRGCTQPLMSSLSTAAGRLGLTTTKKDCDGYRTFGYVANWRPPAGSKNFQVYTANRCRVGPITCDATGQCNAQLSGCVPGPSWVDVKATIASGDILSQRIPVPWPTDASGVKKICS